MKKTLKSILNLLTKIAIVVAIIAVVLLVSFQGMPATSKRLIVAVLIVAAAVLLFRVAGWLAERAKQNKPVESEEATSSEEPPAEAPVAPDIPTNSGEAEGIFDSLYRRERDARAAHKAALAEEAKLSRQESEARNAFDSAKAEYDALKALGARLDFEALSDAHEAMEVCELKLCEVVEKLADARRASQDAAKAVKEAKNEILRKRVEFMGA